MMGFCLSRKKVERIFIFYWRADKECAYCQGGSLLAAILAKELQIPCHLYPSEYHLETTDEDRTLSFAGTDIAPKGVRSFISFADKVPLSYGAENGRTHDT